MVLDELTALSPLDGRYRNKIVELAPYFSEYALIKYRLKVEIEYFIALHEAGISSLAPLSAKLIGLLRNIYIQFNSDEAKEVKKLESRINHDVKAVEYYIKLKLENSGIELLSRRKEFVHFGLTSQDINNTAIPLMIKDALNHSYKVKCEELITVIAEYVEKWKDIPMLARTHGQAASPTRLGKELAVFKVRLQNLLHNVMSQPIPAKFGGATGNFNAHYVAYPNIDWHNFADCFVKENLDLNRSFPTTQIEHYDGLGRIFDIMKGINVVCIDLCQDFWLYISMDYFHQKVTAGEVGSSAMPHKVNPIDFENAEGNLGIANALWEFFSRKLPVSRLQRDLSDSTVMRNIGVAFGHSLIALKSVVKGLKKVRVNEEKIRSELDDHWIVLSEAVQTILRREGIENPYEYLRDYTRGKGNISKENWLSFIQSLQIDEKTKFELLELSPSKYIGR